MASSQKYVLSYADLVKGKQNHVSTSVDLNTLPNPTVKDGKPSIVIPDDMYLEGCDLWKHSLIGRLDFKTLKFEDAKKNLINQWQFTEDRVQFIPMNRGFFIIKLSSVEDKSRVHAKDAWIVEQQALTLIEWFRGFDVEKHKTSHATVWVKFLGFPIEFWVEKTLISLGKTLGTPVVVDRRTLNHFASVLIDIDFSQHDTESVHVQVGDRDFWQEIDIQKKPKFCSKCKIIGHSDDECRRKKHNKPIAPAQKYDKLTDWQEARKKGGINTASVVTNNVTSIVATNNISSVDVNNNVSSAAVSQEVLNEESRSCIDAAILEKTKQLVEEMVRSEAVYRAASAELLKSKQSNSAHTVLVSKTRGKSQKTKSDGLVELDRTKPPHPDKTVTTLPPTPVCDDLLKGSEFLSPNKFDALNSILAQEGEEVSDVFTTKHQAKCDQLIAVQRRIDKLNESNSTSESTSGTHSWSDSEENSTGLGYRARRVTNTSQLIKSIPKRS
ncbi:uncharacterized protein LOC113343975 [Papaver somniferum]|uniref:uncharacterized protein LOC113343975 n=1 Tax=Papaver somniferum TaxID=3469 RepID=UPI000E6FE7DB|nr:uncharacterized protein LOC113343975 [Papaver somniferum]